MTLHISHTTQYTFDAPPSYGLQQIRLTPKQSKGQSYEDWSVSVKGASIQTQFLDHNQNQVHLIKIDEGALHVTVKSEGTVHVEDIDGVVGQHKGPAPLWYFLRQTGLTMPGPGLTAIAKDFAQISGTDLERLHALSSMIGQRVTYKTGQTDSVTTVEQAISAGAGVCQDHTHIFIAAARLADFPARYVSGYLMMNDRIVQEATHAWAEVHVPDLGWTGFDVSNQISPDSRYVRVATGLDYSAAAPISGLTQGGSGESINVSLSVQQQ